MPWLGSDWAISATRLAARFGNMISVQHSSLFKLCGPQVLVTCSTRFDLPLVCPAHPIFRGSMPLPLELESNRAVD